MPYSRAQRAWELVWRNPRPKSIAVLARATICTTRIRVHLYKHGPFSFDLRDELTSYRADGFVELEPQWPYGPRINSTDQSAYVQRSFAKTVAQYESCIEFVAEKLGSKGVAELERLATALFVTLHRNPNSPMQDRAEHLSRIKPHVSLDDATVAVACVDQIIAEAQTGSCTTAR